MANQYNRIDDDGLLFLLTLLEPVIAAAGEDNVIEVIKRNGVTLSVQNKTVDIEVPEDADIEALITAHGYQTANDVDEAITEAIAGIDILDFQPVLELPAAGEKGIIYLVPEGSVLQPPYDEWIWVTPKTGDPHFEELGNTNIDLSGYVQASEMHALTNTEIETIFNQVFGS